MLKPATSDENFCHLSFGIVSENRGETPINKQTVQRTELGDVLIRESQRREENSMVIASIGLDNCSNTHLHHLPGSLFQSGDLRHDRSRFLFERGAHRLIAVSYTHLTLP